jgi:hypothetical protein
MYPTSWMVTSPLKYALRPVHMTSRTRMQLQQREAQLAAACCGRSKGHLSARFVLCPTPGCSRPFKKSLPKSGESQRAIAMALEQTGGCEAVRKRIYLSPLALQQPRPTAYQRRRETLFPFSAYHRNALCLNCSGCNDVQCRATMHACAGAGCRTLCCCWTWAEEVYP